MLYFENHPNNSSENSIAFYNVQAKCNMQQSLGRRVADFEFLTVIKTDYFHMLKLTSLRLLFISVATTSISNVYNMQPLTSVLTIT